MARGQTPAHVSGCKWRTSARVAFSRLVELESAEATDDTLLLAHDGSDGLGTARGSPWRASPRVSARCCCKGNRGTPEF
jgi:hypothetical protein